MENGLVLEIEKKLKALPPFCSVAQWACSAMREKQWKVAAQRWAILRQVYPQSAQAWIDAAVCHQNCGEYDAAEALLQIVVVKSPNNTDGMAAQIRYFLVRGRLGQADELACAAREKFPYDLQLLLVSGQVAQYCGRMEEALDFNSQARKLQPDDPLAWAQYAELAMVAEDWSLALERWTEVLSHFPDMVEWYERAAVAAKNSGDERLARQLTAAREYGIQWLESVNHQNSPHECKLKVSHGRSFCSFVDLVLTKAQLNLKSEASQNYLRYLWWILDPLLYLGAFYVFFGLILRHGGENYPAYLLTGIVPFQWFAKTVQHASTSIINGKGLMNQIRLSPMFFPLVSIVQSLGKQIAVFGMLACFLTLSGLSPTLYWLGFVPVFSVHLLLIVVVSCLVAMVVPFLRDVANLVPTGIQFLFFCSGVFTPLEKIPEAWRSAFLMNPMANILYQYRRIFVHQSWPEWVLLGWLALGVVLCLGVILLSYKRLESIFPRVVLE